MSTTVKEQTRLLAPSNQSASQISQSNSSRRDTIVEDASRSPQESALSSKYGSGTSTPATQAAGSSVEANQALSLQRTLSCVFALGALVLLQATNISLLTTTQSAIADDLDAFEQTSWFTSSYLIAMSSLSPLNGKLSSVFSPRVCIFASSIILAIGGILCSLAKDFSSFITGRVVTGIGASGVYTVSIIIVLELTGTKRRGIGIGLLNSGYTLGVAIGAVVAGALLPQTGWRPLFWFQAPMAIVGGVVLLIAIPADFTANRPKSTASQDGDSDRKPQSIWTRLARLDYVGALTLTASIVCLLYSLSSPKSIPLLPLVLSAIILIVFVLNEICLAIDPIIPITLLRSRGLLLTCFATVGFMMARWSVLFYAPTLAIAVRQWSPAAAGAILVPTNLGFAVGGLTVGWLHIRRPGSFYFPTLLSYAAFPITLAMLALLTSRESPAVLIILAVFLCGSATGAALNYNLAHCLHLIPKEAHYVATALIATFRGFAGSFGSAIGGGLFTRTLRTSLQTHFADLGMLDGRERLVRRLLGSPALVASLESGEKDVAIRGYEEALKALWVAGAVLTVLMVLVQAGTGWRGDSEKQADKPKDPERAALLSAAEDEISS